MNAYPADQSYTSTWDSWTYPAVQPTEIVSEETERFYDDEGRMVREVTKRTVTKTPVRTVPQQTFTPDWTWQPSRIWCGSVTVTN